MPGIVPVTGLTALNRTNPKVRGVRRAVEKSTIVESDVRRPLPSGAREGASGAVVFELREKDERGSLG